MIFDWSKFEELGYPFIVTMPVIVWDSKKPTAAGGAYIDEGQLSMGQIHNGPGLTLDTSMGVF